MDNKIRRWQAILVGMLCVLFLGTAQAKKYYIYGPPMNGSKFKQKIYESELPLGKHYSKFSDEHKKIFLRNYPSLSEASVPPFPKKGLGKLIKPYVKEYRWLGGQSTSGHIRIWIDQNGKVVSYRTEGNLLPDAAEFLVQRAQRIKFTPASCDGAPCEMEFIMEIKSIKPLKLQHGALSS